MNITMRKIKNWLVTVAVALLASMTFSLVPSTVVSAAAPPNVSISSTPLNVIIPSTPQVMIALTNSNSMDSSDNIIDDANNSLSIPAATTHGRAPSSAIMTWSGANGWPANSSPVKYQVPAGYTAPITGATAGNTRYTAAINTYTVFGTGGHNWTCAVSKSPLAIDPFTGVNWIAIPNPTSDPPINFSTPNPAPVPWDDTQTWWFNNDGGASNGYYEGAAPPPLGASVHKVPSARQLFHGDADEFALNGNAGLVSVGMGDGPGGKPTPRVGGGGGGGPPCCAPPPPVCVLYQWIPTYPTTTIKTPIGDNSASRLNVAKESIAQVIQTYGTQVDFGLMSYKLQSGWSSSYSWAYYMSPPGGFTSADFSNVYAPPSAAGEWVINPCFGINPNGNCGNLVSQIGGGFTLAQLQSYQYMLVANSSDDPDVDDVLLAPWAGNYRFMAYSTLTAPTTITPTIPITTPYSPVGPFTLTNYNQGELGACGVGSNCVQVQYAATAPNIPWNGTYTLTPTNSGFTPYSSQVMFTLRGQLWSGNPFPNQGKIKVPVFAPAGTTAAPQAAYLQQFTQYLTPENNVASDDTGIIPGSNPAISYYNYYQNALFAFATQSPIAGLLSSALGPGAWMPPPPPGTCNPAKYVILITDGLPTLDLSGNSWPPPGSAAAVGYGATVAFNADGTLNAAGTNNQAVVDTINQITALNAAGIKTFVVGMGGGVDPTLNPIAAQVLNAMAIAGGTKNYYPGTSPAAVVSQLNAILTIISSTTVASVSGAVSSYALPGANVYQATYTGYDKPFQDWTGDLQAFAVQPNGNASIAASWSAQCQLDISATSGSCGAGGGTGPGNGWSATRLIATWNPASGAGVPFEWSNISAAQQTELQPFDALGQDRLDYLRGDTAEEIHNGGADGFRNRSHLLGDIVDSATLYVGPSNGPYTNDPSYRSFVTSTQSRTPTLYVGANDGMLHAFNAATGNEEFAFIPNGVFANLANLTAPTYNINHQFFVDGSPTAGDVKFAGACAPSCWHTVLAGGLNDGGTSIYALDITNPSAINTEGALASSVLWEFTDPHMGLSYSQPAFALTNDTSSSNANPNGFLLFFGSGYNNSDGNPYLYAVNPQTGQIVSKDVSQVGTPLGPINLCNAVAPNPCNAALPNGLSGVTVVNNTGVMGAPTTTVYAGDLQGNLWKVDISTPDPKNWVVTLLFQARDSFGNPQPITDTPVVTLSPAWPSAPGTVVYFGTGQYLGTPDLTNVNTQSFYAVLDNGTGTPLARGSLVQQTLTATTEVINGNTVTLRTVTNNPVNWSITHGWFMDLPIAGERVVTNPRIFSGEVVFTTYVPSPAALCSGGGQSFLMVLNYSNGGAFQTPQLDINGDGLLNSSDQVAGQNPVGMSLGNVYASAPDILSANLGSIKAVKLTTISTPNGESYGNIVSLGEAGGTPAKLTWTQLQ